MRAAFRPAGGILVAALAALLPACAGTPPDVASQRVAAGAARPALWRAQPAGGGSLYLLGSVHMGRSHIDDFGPAIRQAFASADELVVEVDISKVDKREAEELARRYGFLAPPQTLRDVLSAETWTQLEAYLERRGLSVAQVEGWKPWFLSFVIVQLELGSVGFDPEFGVDNLFIDHADGRMPVVGLETVDSQLGLFDGMPVEVQELMLVDTLSRAEDFGRDTEQLIDAWRRGDDELLEELVLRPLEEAPEFEAFYERVFFDRNETMSARLAELVVDGRSRFVVLGAGHMIGDRGIPALLERRGWSVSRMAHEEAR